MTIQQILQQKVSIYKNKIIDGNRCVIRIGEAPIIDILAHLDRFKENTKILKDLYRRYMISGDTVDKLIYDDVKGRTLLSATFSANFEKYRRLEEPYTPTNVISLDIDHIKEQGLTVNYVKDVLINLDGVFYCQCSASGDGVWALAAVDINDDRGRVFNYYKKALMQHNIELDFLADITRIRYLTYDENYRFKTKDFKMLVLPKIVNTGISLKSDISNKKILAKTNDNFNYRAISQAIRDGLWVSSDRFNSWSHDARIIATACGEMGRSLFHELSRQSPEYKNEKDVDRVYNYAINHRLTEDFMPKIYKMLKDRYGKDWKSKI